MQQTVRIFERSLGRGAPCFLVGEAGTHHNGGLERALRLIRVAADAGLDGVQLDLHSRERTWAPGDCGKDPSTGLLPIAALQSAAELNPGWLPELRDQAHDLGLAFIVTPLDETAAARAGRFADALRVASFDLTFTALLRAVAESGRPVILGTAASSTADVARAVGCLRELSCRELVLLHATASYPAPPGAVQARGLVALRDAFDVPTGLADHSRDPVVAPVVAVTLGASLIEKHFTLSRELKGPDQAWALEPHELALTVRRVREAEQVLGRTGRGVLQIEVGPRRSGRRGLYTTRPVRTGESFDAGNVRALRRGVAPPGLPADRLDEVLASQATAELAAGAPITAGDIRRRR